MAYKLLDEFQKLFDGNKYNHRNSTLGDHIASFLFEDLYDLGRSPKYLQFVATHDRVLNSQNKAVGKKARRGDGTFGVKVPYMAAVTMPGHIVALAQVATIEIGIEVKILAKAMIKQIDRVCTDMVNQSSEFKKHGGNPICVGIVGINRANAYTGYEGARAWPTDGKKHKHPIQEAAEAEKRLLANVQPHFDELIVLRFSASNAGSYDFAWTDKKKTETEYASALVRIAREYETRF